MKAAVPSNTVQPPNKYRRIAAAVVYACVFWVVLRPSSQQVEREEEPFDWYKLVPSENITWADCYHGQKCARLSLPLDYLTPQGPKTEIALRMIPATDRAHYQGTILVNPGGPGGSGTRFISLYGSHLSHIVGPRFDVLGFDPRGVGATTPAAQCFNTSSTERALWAARWDANVLLNLTDGSIPLARSRERLVAERCQAALGGNGREDINGTAQEWGPGRFMSTPSVATDMLRITEGLGQERVQFWGFSYGSDLGQYFATMYPDKVGRMVLDGVYDAYKHRRFLWDDGLGDMDNVIGSFYSFCSKAGPDKCPLWEPTAEEVEQRVKRIIDQIEGSPLPVPFAQPGPTIITKGHILNRIFTAAFSPVIKFKPLADELRAIELNNQTALQATFGDAVDCNCDRRGPAPWDSPNEALYAVMFGDTGLIQERPGDVAEQYAFLANQSALAAPILFKHILSAFEWKMEAKWRYTGPFSANTSHPVLIAQPTYDPVCPLSHAKGVRGYFSGAGLLEQRSFGHCTISAPSMCSAKHIRAYFVSGTLPKEGTVCHPDELPFIGKVNTPSILSLEDRKLQEALDALKHANFYRGR